MAIKELMTDYEIYLLIKDAYKSFFKWHERFRKPGIAFTEEQKKKIAEYVESKK